MTKAVYKYNQLLSSMIDGGRLFFVPKVRVLDGGVLRVVGVKYEVSAGTREFAGALLAAADREGVRVSIRFRPPARKTKK